MRVIITGASKGLGKALAKVFANNGYNLILIARNNNLLEEVKKEINNNVEIDIYPYDLTKNPNSLAIELINKYNDIDTLINNAGIGISGDITLHDIKDEEALIDLNIKALTLFTIEFSKYFKEKNKGSILNISSVGSMIPGKYMASYYASKSYVSSLSYSISLELKKTNINVVAFNLPRIDTEFDKYAKRQGKLKKGCNPLIIAKKIYKNRYKNGIKNIGFSTKMTNILVHLLPKYLLALFIGNKLR